MTPAEFRALLEKATARPWESDQAVYPYEGEHQGKESRAIYHQPKPNHIVEVIESPDTLHGECIHNPADQAAIVATMNRAELFAELWNFVRAVANYNNFSNRADYEEACEILAKLEAAP